MWIRFVSNGYYIKFTKKFYKWVSLHQFQFALFNILVLVLVLLRSAGYFAPFFPLSVNAIVVIALVLAVILLGAGSTALFLTALVFWIFAALHKIFKVDVWAERAAIYMFEAFILGWILLILEVRGVLQRRKIDTKISGLFRPDKS